MTIRNTLSLLALGIFLAGCQSSSTPSEALTATGSSVEKRQIESRRLEVEDERFLLQTVIATLQDFGFEIDESDARSGIISGSKSQAGGPFTLALYDVRVTVTTRMLRNRTALVRANFQKFRTGKDPRFYRGEPLDRPDLYRTFFDKLEQSIFLGENKV